MKQKPHLFFAHANGFPSPCYRKMLEPLKLTCKVDYIDSIGHNANYPITDNWGFLVDELLARIQEVYEKPIIGVGHSLGGLLHYLAAAKQPKLYQRVILLDSPIHGPFRSILIRTIKQLGVIDRFSPGGGAKRRRRHWVSTDAAMEYLQSKSLFQNFDRDSLQDYIRFGMTTTAEGLSLAFDPNIEYQIYRTFPHIMSKVAQHFKTPLVLLYGESSTVIQASVKRSMQRKFPQCQFVKVPGDHLFPFQFPLQTAEAIQAIIHPL